MDIALGPLAFESARRAAQVLLLPFAADGRSNHINHGGHFLERRFPSVRTHMEISLAGSWATFEPVFGECI
jgi:hypothetical protein